MDTITHSQKRRLSSPHGGVIVEFLLVLPLLFLIFGGVLGLGRAYAQLSWVSNASYEVALAGAGSQRGQAGASAAVARNTLLGELPYYNLVSAPNFNSDEIYDQFPSEPLLENTVRVRLNAEIPLLFSRWVTTFQVETVLPVLVLGQGSAGSLTQFQNPACLYDCNGDVITVGGGVCCTNPASCPQSCS